MGGVIDWQGLEVLAAMHGVEDIDVLIDQLVAIREFQELKRNVERT